MYNVLLSVSECYNYEILETLIDYKDKMSVQLREVFVKIFLKESRNSKQKQTLIEACGDRRFNLKIMVTIVLEKFMDIQ